MLYVSAYPLIYTIMCVLQEDEGYTRTDTRTQVHYFSVQLFYEQVYCLVTKSTLIREYYHLSHNYQKRRPQHLK